MKDDSIVQKIPLPSIKDGKLKSQLSPFQQRLAQAKQAEAEASKDASKLPNRIALMLDCSGSMAQKSSYSAIRKPHFSEAKSKIELLQEAIQNFIQRSNFLDTSIAIETFPSHSSVELTCDRTRLITSALSLSAGGNTPMHQCVERVIESIALTRGIIVSDGEATDWHGMRGDDDVYSYSGGFQDSLLQKYMEAQIPIDCVHIGDSTDGESLLRSIAKATGGIYIKFTDVSAFSVAFGYLAPAYRAMLTSGQIDARELGASEVKK